MNEINSFGDNGSTEGLHLTQLDEPRHEVQATADATKLADALASQVKQEESRLDEELVNACAATGATGAAIALFRGQEIVCYASTGPHAPGVGARLDPHSGLSGSCIQSRQVQHCGDTRTDSRVDSEACRQLGVRSVVVLPLMDRERLLGVFEVFSSHPDAFDRKDLGVLQTLARRIVESNGKNWEAAAIAAPEGPSSGPGTPIEVIPSGDTPLKSDSEFPTLRHAKRKSAILATMLNLLVIAAALLLGTLVGWRLGWEKATAASQFKSRPHKVDAPSTNGQTNRAESRSTGIQTVSSLSQECGQSATSPVPPSKEGGLTICQGDRLVFRSTDPAPVRNLKTSNHPSGLSVGQLRQ